ncbi:FAD-dependent monooxygenase [Kitasatospora sp. NPDC052896]|uniref:FAD-dependent monooxygenase n=1 Tax=Kitasatospora sp. NPDC052896 TaxID=3364061 RepID=UPI0037CC2D51
MDEVVVVGAGPTGLLLAAELRLAGVPVKVLERAAERSPYSKALALHARSLEVLAMRGIAERFTREGSQLPVAGYGGVQTRLDLSLLDSRFPYALIIPQRRTEQLLEERLRELGGGISWQHGVLGVRQDADGAELDVEGPDGPYTLRTGWVVGCDGAGSTVRSSAGIDFRGSSTTVTGFLGDVWLDLPQPAASRPYSNEHGGINIFALGDGYHRIVGTYQDFVHVPSSQPFTLEELRTAVMAVAGTDFGLRKPRWLSRYGNAARQAAQYRKGRVLLAGDAAHMHMPFGGQGLNVGLQDAFNLGWKLASVCHGRAPADLLDTYHEERHPVGASLLENTQAQTALGAVHTPDIRALRTALSRILSRHPEVTRELAGQVSGLDVVYPAGDGDPLVGTRVPDVDLDGATASSLYSLMDDGRFTLLHFADTASAHHFAAAVTFAGGADRLHVARARAMAMHHGWDGVDSVLVRPDGHVASAGYNPGGLSAPRSTRGNQVQATQRSAGAPAGAGLRGEEVIPAADSAVSKHEVFSASH